MNLPESEVFELCAGTPYGRMIKIYTPAGNYIGYMEKTEGMFEHWRGRFFETRQSHDHDELSRLLRVLNGEG